MKFFLGYATKIIRFVLYLYFVKKNLRWLIFSLKNYPLISFDVFFALDILQTIEIKNNKHIATLYLYKLTNILVLSVLYINIF